jgi:hypothetical protein
MPSLFRHFAPDPREILQQRLPRRSQWFPATKG